MAKPSRQCSVVLVTTELEQTGLSCRLSNDHQIKSQLIYSYSWVVQLPAVDWMSNKIYKILRLLIVVASIRKTLRCHLYGKEQNVLLIVLSKKIALPSNNHQIKTMPRMEYI